MESRLLSVCCVCFRTWLEWTGRSVLRDRPHATLKVIQRIKQTLALPVCFLTQFTYYYTGSMDPQVLKQHKEAILFSFLPSGD